MADDFLSVDELSFDPFASNFGFDSFSVDPAYLQAATSLASPLLTSYFQPTSSYPVGTAPVPQAMPTSAGSVPMVARAVAAGIPRWSAMFPNLWQYVRTKFPTMSPSSAVSGLLSMMNKYGPTALTAFAGAAVIADLLTYKVTRKRRRMNVANVKALRRSVRRMKGFNRLAHRVSAQLGRAGARRRSTRCGTCRKNPCSC